MVVQEYPVPFFTRRQSERGMGSTMTQVLPYAQVAPDSVTPLSEYLEPSFPTGRGHSGSQKEEAKKRRGKDRGLSVTPNTVEAQ